MGFAFLKKLFGGSAGANASKDQEALEDAPILQAEDCQEDNCGSDCGCDNESCEGKKPQRSRRSRRSRHNRQNASENSDVQEETVSLEQLQEFVRYIAVSLVDKPEDVTMDVVEKEHLTVIRLRCDKPDIGKIVGKGGKTISAVRALVSGVAGRYGQRVTVDVLD